MLNNKIRADIFRWRQIDHRSPMSLLVVERSGEAHAPPKCDRGINGPADVAPYNWLS